MARPSEKVQPPPPYEECGFCQHGVIYGGTDKEADCPYCNGTGITGDVKERVIALGKGVIDTWPESSRAAREHQPERGCGLRHLGPSPVERSGRRGEADG